MNLSHHKNINHIEEDVKMADRLEHLSTCHILYSRSVAPGEAKINPVWDEERGTV